MLTPRVIASVVTGGVCFTVRGWVHRDRTVAATSLYPFQEHPTPDPLTDSCLCEELPLTHEPCSLTPVHPAHACSTRRHHKQTLCSVGTEAFITEWNRKSLASRPRMGTTLLQREIMPLICRFSSRVFPQRQTTSRFRSAPCVTRLVCLQRARMPPDRRPPQPVVPPALIVLSRLLIPHCLLAAQQVTL